MDSIEINNKYKENKKIAKEKARKDRILSSSKKPKATTKDKAGEKVPKAKRYIRKPTGERQMFEEIRNERPHICKICRSRIPEALTRCFAHIFNKWMYPQYRLIKANIALVCSIECHNKLDRMVLSFKKDSENMLYFDKIKWLIK